MQFRNLALSAGALLLISGNMAMAQTTVTLPDLSQSTMLTAAVSEQAQVTVPAGVTFNVMNVGASTVASSASSVSASNIVLATATKRLKVSVRAAAASFTPPVAAATTWAASDVSWNAASWTSGIGASGTLSDASYNEVGSCDVDTSSCDTSNLTFTLAAKGSVRRAGNHTLTVTWKFESIGS